MVQKIMTLKNNYSVNFNDSENNYLDCVCINNNDLQLSDIKISENNNKDFTSDKFYDNLEIVNLPEDSQVFPERIQILLLPNSDTANSIINLSNNENVEFLELSFDKFLDNESNQDSILPRHEFTPYKNVEKKVEGSIVAVYIDNSANPSYQENVNNNFGFKQLPLKRTIQDVGANSGCPSSKRTKSEDNKKKADIANGILKSEEISKLYSQNALNKSYISDSNTECLESLSQDTLSSIEKSSSICKLNEKKSLDEPFTSSQFTNSFSSEKNAEYLQSSQEFETNPIEETDLVSKFESKNSLDDSFVSEASNFELTNSFDSEKNCSEKIKAYNKPADFHNPPNEILHQLPVNTLFNETNNFLSKIVESSAYSKPDYSTIFSEDVNGNVGEFPLDFLEEVANEEIIPYEVENDCIVTDDLEDSEKLVDKDEARDKTVNDLNKIENEVKTSEFIVNNAKDFDSLNLLEEPKQIIETDEVGENVNELISEVVNKVNESIMGHVANHYNNIEEKGLDHREASRIYYLKNFNNWVKTVLINKYVRKTQQNKSIKVLDLCCGKGGDLIKWRRTEKISYLLCVDIAGVSVEHCHSRYNDLKKRSRNLFKAEFLALDCSKNSLKQEIKNKKINEFDLVSCQFAFHYSFESLPQAECMFQNASENLRKGGYFFGTIPNANELVKRWKKTDGNKFGNDVYSIEFHCNKNEIPLFGAKYNCYLTDAIDCPEFLVHTKLFKKLGEKYNLKLVCFKSFPEFYQYELENSSTKNELNAMLTKALETFPPYSNKPLKGSIEDYKHAQSYFQSSDKIGEKIGTLSKSEWEVISMYAVFAFQKV